MKQKIVWVGWTHPETEEEYRVKVHVYAGSKNYMDDGCLYPGDPPEVDVLEVRKDEKDAPFEPVLDAMMCGYIEDRSKEYDKIFDAAMEKASQPDDTNV